MKSPPLKAHFGALDSSLIPIRVAGLVLRAGPALRLAVVFFFFSVLDTPLFLFFYTLHQSLLGIACVTLTLSLSLTLTDLSFMEEWPCGSKTLERHDGSSPHCRVPVACSQGLRKPATHLPMVFFLSSEFSIRLSTPTYPLLRYNRGLGRQIMCVISLFSGLFDILCPQSS